MKIDEAYNCFRKSVDSDRLAQAYLLIGPPRGAAGVLAERVLQLLFCESADVPCGHCHGCRAVEAHTTPDILWVEPQKKSRAISIDQVRGLQGRTFQTSVQGGWKGCVIVAADRMGAGAANAFLKTLEEPPPRSLFLLLSDTPNALLPTIVSRCQWVTLNEPPERLPDAWLDPVTTVLGGVGPGGALATLATTDRLVSVLKELKAAAAADEADKSAGEATDETDETLAARAEARYRELRTSVLRAILLWYRDLVLLVSGSDESLLHYREHADALRQRAVGLTMRDALRNVDAVARLNRQLEQNLPEGQALNFAFSQVM